MEGLNQHSLLVHVKAIVPGTLIANLDSIVLNENGLKLCPDVLEKVCAFYCLIYLINELDFCSLSMWVVRYRVGVRGANYCASGPMEISVTPSPTAQPTTQPTNKVLPPPKPTRSPTTSATNADEIPLKYVGNNPIKRLDVCEGDCDREKDW